MVVLGAAAADATLAKPAHPDRIAPTEPRRTGSRRQGPRVCDAPEELRFLPTVVRVLHLDCVSRSRHSFAFRNRWRAARHCRSRTCCDEAVVGAGPAARQSRPVIL